MGKLEDGQEHPQGPCFKENRSVGQFYEVDFCLWSYLRNKNREGDCLSKIKCDNHWTRSSFIYLIHITYYILFSRPAEISEPPKIKNIQGGIRKISSFFSFIKTAP